MSFVRRTFYMKLNGSFNLIGKTSRSIASDYMLSRVETTITTSSSNGHIVIVEGNIGVGKTTLTCQLGTKLNYRVFLEPTSGNPYLAKFYEEPKKYALKMQLWLFRQRCRMYLKAVRHWMETGQGVLLDRSLFSDNVFAAVSYSDGFISHEGYQNYCSLRKQVLDVVPYPDIMVYLNAVPEECKQRIVKRGRECETGISIDYLSSLHSGYCSLLEEMRSQGWKVFHYDWSEFGISFEVDKDIRNFENTRSKLDERNYDSIYKNVQNLFKTNQEINDESFSEEEVDDDDLQELEQKLHNNETDEQLSLKS